MELDEFVQDAPHVEIGADVPIGGQETAVTPTVPVEPKPEEKPKPEPEPEPAPKVEPEPIPVIEKPSVLLKEPPKTVPLPVVSELRQRLRERESELVRANERLKEVEALQAADTSLAGIADDEPLTAGQARALYAAQRKAAAQLAEANRLAQETARKEAFSQFVKASEADARTRHEDFDSVLREASDAGMISDQDHAAALQTEHPAEFLYQRIQRKKAFFGIVNKTEQPKPKEEPKPAPAPTPAKEEPVADTNDNIFQDVFSPRV